MKIKILNILFFTALVALFVMLGAAIYEGTITDIPGITCEEENSLTVYVDGGRSEELSGSYGSGETATIIAPATSGTKSFSHWVLEGSVISYSNPLKMTMYAPVTLYAIYSGCVSPAKPVAGITSLNMPNDGGWIIFRGITDGDVSGSGMVYSTAVNGKDLMIGGSEVTEVQAKKSADLDASATAVSKTVMDDNNCWMYKIRWDGGDEIYHVRAYVTTEEGTFYSKVKDVKPADLISGRPRDVILKSFDQGIYEGSTLEGMITALKNSTHTVTFDANGGRGEQVTQIFSERTPKPLKVNTFKLKGYKFICWKTGQKKGRAYSDGQKVTFDSDTTLYAQWVKNKKKKKRCRKRKRRLMAVW